MQYLVKHFIMTSSPIGKKVTTKVENKYCIMIGIPKNVMTKKM